MLKNFNKFIIFRAYDIRGKYPSEINEKIVGEIISRFLNSQLSIIKGQLLIVVGRDARLSSLSLYRAAIKQLITNNQQLITIKAGTITTPMLSFLVSELKADLGIMITASHNPKNYNGLKIVKKNAEPVSGMEIKKLVNNYS